MIKVVFTLKKYVAGAGFAGLCLLVFPSLACIALATATVTAETTVFTTAPETMTSLPSETGGLAVLRQNEAFWHSWNIKNYSFHIEVGRFRPPQSADIDVTVVDGTETGFEVITSHDADYTEVLAKYGTIDKLFETLERSFQNIDYTTGAEYDPVYGFPTFLDAYRDVLDFSFAVYISDFKPDIPVIPVI